MGISVIIGQKEQFYEGLCAMKHHWISAPDKKGKRDNLGIIFHISPVKRML